MKNPPLLRVSRLSCRVYLLTRYRVRKNQVIAITKYDVTDEFVIACEDWRRLMRQQRAEARRAKPDATSKKARGPDDTREGEGAP